MLLPFDRIDGRRDKVKTWGKKKKANFGGPAFCTCVCKFVLLLKLQYHLEYQEQLIQRRFSDVILILGRPLTSDKPSARR